MLSTLVRATSAGALCLLLSAAVAVTPAEAHSSDWVYDDLGESAEPVAAVSDTSGHVFILNEGDSTIAKVSGQRYFARLDSGCKPQSLAIAPSGDMFVSCSGTDSISRVSPYGKVTPNWSRNGAGAYPIGVATDKSGNVYSANYGTSTITKVSSRGVVTPVFARLDPADHPVGIATDSAGNIYVTESQTNRISKVSATGVLQESFGILPSGDDAGSFPVSVSVDPWGSVYSANASGSVTKFASDGSVLVASVPLPAGDHLPVNLLVDSYGDVFVGDETAHAVTGLSAEGLAAESVGGLLADSDLRAFAFSGNQLLIADHTSGKIVSSDFEPTSSPATTTAGFKVGVPVSMQTRLFDFAGVFNRSVVTSGQLPPGLTIDEATGLISGTPTETGTFDFELSYLNHWGASHPAPEHFTVE